MYAVVFKPDKEYKAKADKLRKEKESAHRNYLGYSEVEYRTFIKYSGPQK